ncbi:MAG TPA: hypothetical protein VK843_18075 [Planctomycetota bacterium]|nr:hypothetical protein [Planctomycetota bacterium]
MVDDSNFDLEGLSEEKAPDPIETLVMPIWRARWWVLAAGFAGLCFGAFQAAIKINTFDSTGKLLVRGGIRESATPESLVVTGGTGGQANARETMANEIHLLSDPEVFRRVVALVGPDKILASYDPSASDGPDTPFLDRMLHSFQTRWSASGDSDSDAGGHPPDRCEDCARIAEQVVARSMTVQPEAGSSIFTVTYTAHTPRLASEVANAFLKAAIAHHRDFFRGGHELELINQRLHEAQAELNAVDLARATFHNECGVYDIIAQSSEIMQELAALEAEIVAGNATEAGLRGKKDFLDQAIASEPIKLATTTEQPRVPNPTHNFLMQQKLQLELAPVADSAGSVQKLEQLKAQRAEQLSQLESRLAIEPEFIQMAPLRQLGPNPQFQLLVQQARDTESDLFALKQSQDIRRARVAELREERLHLESCRGQANSLDRDYESATLRLAQCTQAHEKLTLLNTLDQSELTNLLVLQTANLPLTKSGPKRGRIVLIGGILGAAAGAGVALLLAKLNRRVRRPDDLAKWAGVPVLETVPEADLPRPKRALVP